MPRLSVNELTTYQWSFEEDVCHYAEAGISAIGIWRQKLSDYGEEKGVELLRETNLEVSKHLYELVNPLSHKHLQKATLFLLGVIFFQIVFRFLVLL